MMIVILLFIAMVLCSVRVLSNFKNHLILGKPFSGYFEIYVYDTENKTKKVKYIQFHVTAVKETG